MVERRAGASSPVSGTAPIVSLRPRELLDATPDVVFACDHEGVLLWLNRAFESLTGRPAADFIGRPVLTLVAPAARPRALRTFLRQRRGQTRLVAIVLPVLAAHGRELRVSARVRLLDHADGGVVFIGAAREADANATAANGSGVTADAAGLGAQAGEPDAGVRPALTQDVLATMSHESRFHMNAIMGMAQLLLDTRLDQDQKDMVDVICGAGESLLELVNNAIEYSKLETGTLDLERIAFDLRVAVEEMAILLAPQAREKGTEFECRVYHEVPSRLWGDPGRVRQMLLHLGENAVRAANRGRVTIAVERRCEDECRVTVRFTVADTSPGTSAEHVARLLKGCRPPNDASSSFELLIVHRLVELMGGTMGVESEPGAGGRVWFELPFEMQMHHEQPTVPLPTKSELAGERVLVVDPAPMMRRTVMAKLEALGCQVAEAGQPEEALAILRQAAQAGEAFRLAVIERELSPGDGEELGASIRAEHALDATLTLLMTSVGRRGDAARARARGFSAYLPKAIDAGELAETLCEVLHQATVPSGGSPMLVTRYSLAEARRGRTHILVVEANTVSQLVSQWALNRLGYQVEVVGTAAAAWAACQRASFDVALVDTQLPEGDGLSLVRELRALDQDNRRTVIVAMVDADSTTRRAEWQDAGTDEFITKPVNLELMTALVERVTRTGTAWGPEVEDETAQGRMKGAGSKGQTAPGAPAGRVEVVVPDVDRLVTESDVQEAMAAAMCTAMTKTPQFPAAEVTPAGEVTSTIEAPTVTEEAHAMTAAEEPLPSVVDMLTAADVETLRGSDVADTASGEPPAEAVAPPAVDALEDPTSEAASGPEAEVVGLPVEAATEERVAECPPECAAEPPTCSIVPEVEPAESRAQAPKSEPAGNAHTSIPETSGGHAPTIDLEQLEEASMGSPSLRETLLATFLSEIRPRLDRLTRALNAGDARRFQSEAHGLHVLSGTIGAKACADVFRELEGRGEHGELAGAVVALRNAYLEVIRAEEQAAKLKEERLAA